MSGNGAIRGDDTGEISYPMSWVSPDTADEGGPDSAARRTDPEPQAVAPGPDRAVPALPAAPAEERSGPAPAATAAMPATRTAADATTAVPTAGPEQSAQGDAQQAADTAPLASTRQAVAARTRGRVATAQDTGDGGEPPRRIPKPIVAGALLGGLVLIGLPLVVALLAGDDDSRDSTRPAAESVTTDDANGGDGGTGENAGSPATTAPPRPQIEPGYVGTAGYRCTDPGASVEYAGFVEDGDDGWTRHREGGQTDWGGCDGQYVAMPMTGSEQDGDRHVLWSFKAGQPGEICDVEVYIPKNDDIEAVGATAANYSVLDGMGPDGPLLTRFDINQTDAGGVWINGITVPGSGNGLSIKLHDRGTDTTQRGKEKAHIAAAEAYVECKKDGAGSS
ncbi:hypothetical protein AB0D49_40720 [Streptomyces sp. NPDC048290]|uniref:hypothetical protein n=1 Tax=Streptomyces sp. NPDC048290 TaxID=3155811 RepID=UPI00344594CF